MSKYLAYLLPYLLIYLAMAYLSSLTPLVCDDFTYWPYWIHWPHKIFDLSGLIEQEIWHWQNWNGRSVASLINRIFLLSNDYLYVFINPLIMCIIILSGQYIVFGEIYLFIYRYWHPLFIFACIWIFTPLFGEAYLWRTGTAYYLYTTFFVCIYLVVCRIVYSNQHIKHNIIFIVLWYIIAIFSGWSNENIGYIPFMISCIVIIYSYHKRISVPYWFIVGAILSLSGYLMLMLAPGQLARIAVDAPDFHDRSIWNHIKSFWAWWIFIQNFIYPLIVIFFIQLFSILKKFNRDIFIITIILFIFSQISIAIFAFSPLFSSRAVSNSVILLIFSILPIIFCEKLKYIKYLRSAVIIIIFCVFSVSFYKNGIINYNIISIIYQERLKSIHNSDNPILQEYPIGNNRWSVVSNLSDFDAPKLKDLIVRKYGLQNLTIKHNNISK